AERIAERAPGDAREIDLAAPGRGLDQTGGEAAREPSHEVAGEPAAEVAVQAGAQAFPDRRGDRRGREAAPVEFLLLPREDGDALRDRVLRRAVDDLRGDRAPAEQLSADAGPAGRCADPRR